MSSGNKVFSRGQNLMGMFVQHNVPRANQRSNPQRCRRRMRTEQRGLPANGVAISGANSLLRPLTVPSRECQTTTIIGRPEHRLRSRLDKLTPRQSLATLVSASVHCSRGHDFRALLRNRPALADAPIHRVDVDDHRLFKTRHVVSGDCANARWRASVFSLSHRQQRENCRKEIRPAAAHAETRSHLYKTCDQPRLALHLFRLRE